RGEARLSTWIYRIVANVCVQEHGRPVPASLDDEKMGREVRAARSIDRRFGDFELRDRLEKAIARLPPHYRLVIAAHYLEGVRYEDLADALQIPLGTVKTQLHRAKQQLRRLLETELKYLRIEDCGLRIADSTVHWRIAGLRIGGVNPQSSIRNPQ